MATAEAASAALGPRYAPDDPTLPKPWKGLIDGSTGITYYWNPETNVTQYEKPSNAPPSYASSISPTTQTTTSSSQAVLSDGMLAAHETQIGEDNQQQLQQQHHLNQFPQHGGHQIHQQNSQVPPAGQQGSQIGQGFNHHHPQYGQVAHMWSSPHGPPYSQQGQTVHNQFSQQMVQSGHQVPQPFIQQTSQQPVQPMPQQLGPQNHQFQGSSTGMQTGHHFTPQEMNYAPYVQQPIHGQGSQIMQHQSRLSAHGLSSSYQEENKAGIPPQDESDFQKRKQSMYSPQSGQVGSAALQNLPHTDGSESMLQQGVVSGQGQIVGSVAHMMDPNIVGPYASGSELVPRHHVPAYQNHPSPLHGPHPGQLPPGRSNLGYEQSHHGRARNEHYYNANNDSSVMRPQQPKLAALPGPINQQNMRYPGLPIHNSSSADTGPLNSVPGHVLPDMYVHGSGSLPITNQSLGRALHIHPGSSDFMSLTPDAYRQRHEVTATGDNVPAPFMTFEATGFPPEILKEMHSAGFTSPTPIQAQTWPIALQSRDIVAIAKTGSGKTLGYLIPAFVLLRQCRNNPLNGPTVLVLAPTRELATQIQAEAVKFGRSSRLSCTCLYGGAPKGPQLRELDRGADIVVATPGRLNDILDMKKINFRQVSLLVLDEADRMLDMGFEPQIRKIVNEIPPRRQTLMYTATWPKEVRKIAADLLVNPVQVNIGNVDELAANKAITQYVEVVPQMEKLRRLEHILRSQERGSKVIVFCSTKKLCDELTRSIRRNFGAAAIHGDKSQDERDWVLNQFRSGKAPILVATDVAARGLDIKDIRVVINYDFPTGVEDYVHRIGRTGRAGATGVAYTFLSEQDWKHVPDLIKVLEGANQQVPPEVREIAMRGGPGYGKDRSGMNRHDSHATGGRWDSGGGFAGRGGFRDGGNGSRGGGRMRENFSGRGGGGGRSDFFSGRGGRDGRRFSGPGGGHVGWGRDDRGQLERFNNRDSYARGRGRGRFDQRDGVGSSRGRHYSRSPEKVRTWGSMSRSCSRSRSRSRSWSRSRSRSRSWSRGRSRSRSRSPSPSRSYSQVRGRSRSWSRGGSRERNRSPVYGHKSPDRWKDSKAKDDRKPEHRDELVREDLKLNAGSDFVRGDAIIAVGDPLPLVEPSGLAQDAAEEVKLEEHDHCTT